MMKVRKKSSSDDESNESRGSLLHKFRSLARRCSVDQTKQQDEDSEVGGDRDKMSRSSNGVNKYQILKDDKSKVKSESKKLKKAQTQHKLKRKELKTEKKEVTEKDFDDPFFNENDFFNVGHSLKQVSEAIGGVQVLCTGGVSAIIEEDGGD